jgi:hypothetical protein
MKYGYWYISRTDNCRRPIKPSLMWNAIEGNDQTFYQHYFQEPAIGGSISKESKIGEHWNGNPHEEQWWYDRVIKMSSVASMNDTALSPGPSEKATSSSTDGKISWPCLRMMSTSI